MKVMFSFFTDGKKHKGCKLDMLVITPDLECPWHDNCIICRYDVTGANFENSLCTFGQSELESSMYNSKQWWTRLERGCCWLSLPALSPLLRKKLTLKAGISIQFLASRRQLVSTEYQTGLSFWTSNLFIKELFSTRSKHAGKIVLTASQFWCFQPCWQGGLPTGYFKFVIVFSWQVAEDRH